MSLALTILLKSTMILASAAILCLALRRASASTRHTIWLLGLLCAALLPLASVGLPSLNLPVLPASEVSISSTQGPIELESAGDRGPSSPFITSAIVDSGPGATAVPSSTLKMGWTMTDYLAFAWAIGFMFVLVRFLLGIFAVKRLAKASSAITDEGWHDLLHNLRSQLRVSRPVHLVIGGASFPPMTWSLFRNVILLPQGAASWTDDRRRYVLAHEVAHIKRYDGISQVLAQTVCAFYWFNPLVWYAAMRLRHERELACDDRVLNLGANRHDYAAHLVEVARGIQPISLLSAATISMVHPSQLETRLRAILDAKKNRRLVSLPAAGILSLVAATLTILLATAHLIAVPLVPLAPPELTPMISVPEPLHEAPVSSIPVAQPPAPAALPQIENKALQKWIDEDVAYIITPDERQAFQMLQTDEEREHFIENFWLRRDPTPGTVENEFKEEYYARIAHANDRFTSSNKPGWRTDRGLIYILHGKPDAIEDHPSGGSYQRPAYEGGGTIQTYPFQVWTYRHIEGKGDNVSFEFVDPSLTGEFRLTFNPLDKGALATIPRDDIQLYANAFPRPDINFRQVLSKLYAFNKTFYSMQALLEKTNVTVLVGDHEVSTGEIFYKKGATSSQILLDLQTPAPQIVLIDAGKVTVYAPKLKQANQISIGGGKDQAESHLLADLSNPGEDLAKAYNVSLAGEAVIDGKSAAILELMPKTSSMFTSIRLWINEQAGNPVQVQFNQPNGDYVIFKFINPEFNVNLPNSKFDLKSIIPTGVTIQTIGG